MQTTRFDKSAELEDRTAKLGEEVIDLVKTIKENNLNRSIINQLVRSATSVGANYQEANGASSPKDFRNKIYICKKEAKETKHWLRMLVKTNSEVSDKARKIWCEAQELVLIFSKALATMEEKSKNKKMNNK